MLTHTRPGRWAAIVAALLVCLLAGAGGRPTQSARLGAPSTQPLAQTPAASPTPTAPEKPILLTDPVPDPQQEGVVYFPQTGHTLRGPFLRYWQEHGGLAQFGYPLTEEFFEPSGPDNAPLQVQYFERNRFELHPENAGTPHDVLLGTLGRDFRAQDPPAPQQPDALYFPETGHNLSGKFREYWEAHGGLAIHGYPITEAAMERSTDGKDYLVQWFERSRFELHPENAGSEYEVLLGLLGRQLSEKKGYPYGWYPPYGRAVDWSWVSGPLEIYIPAPCEAIGCTCSLMRYQRADGSYLQLINGTDRISPLVLRGRRSSMTEPSSDPLVAFGQRATANEPFIECTAAPDEPGFLVTSWQDNPGR
jgi:hypothetical protein